MGLMSLGLWEEAGIHRAEPTHTREDTNATQGDSKPATTCHEVVLAEKLTEVKGLFAPTKPPDLDESRILFFLVGEKKKSYCIILLVQGTAISINSLTTLTLMCITMGCP